eukprot:c22571_g2_i3 orf=540-848(-)
MDFKQWSFQNPFAVSLELVTGRRGVGVCASSSINYSIHHRIRQLLIKRFTMPLRMLLEIEPPAPMRYLLGAFIMMVGVVLPVGYMMFRNKRVPSVSVYGKQT